jgi:endonuclease YncB( thermonuclease family)
MNLAKWILSAFLPFAATVVQAGDIVSFPRYTVTVVDGDTIKRGGIYYRLHGIDAPEMDQLCECDGRTIPCGWLAAGQLEALIKGRGLKCEVLNVDSYGRPIARCMTSDGRDISEEMVMSGYAFAYERYSRDYLAVDRMAEAAKIGLRGMNVELPWEYRERIRRR